MIIENLELENFRLHRKTKINFSDKLNFIIGSNGQGKTTILESVYFLCTTKSFNQSTDRDCVTFDCDYFNINGKFFDLTKDSVRLFFSTETKKKSVFLNDKQIYSSASLIGKFPVVTLLQTDYIITKGSPADRRKFIDIIVSQASNTYLKILIDYNKTLKNKSALLHKIKETGNKSLINQLDVWNESLVKYGSEIIRHRIKFLEEFNLYMEFAYSKITGIIEKPEIVYSGITGFVDEIDKIFTIELNRRKNEEIARCSNLIGPHRDDFIFFIDSLELKKYGSQGQHKTFQISLKFAQFDYLFDKIGIKPVFLLDDVFGELDKLRAGKISEIIKLFGQAFITMTDFTNYEQILDKNDKLFKVNNGCIEVIQ